jgi:hypothetical protein
VGSSRCVHAALVRRKSMQTAVKGARDSLQGERTISMLSKTTRAQRQISGLFRPSSHEDARMLSCLMRPDLQACKTTQSHWARACQRPWGSTRSSWR